VSPFPFPGPLPPDAVVGRDALVEELIERITARRVTALIGPRRFGKTSVLGRVADLLQTAGTSVVQVDLFEVTSMADFAIRLDAALNGAKGPVRRRLGELSATFEIRLGLINVEFTRRRSEQPDPIATVHVLLDALVAAAQHTPTTVMFDEFSGIANLNGAAGLLRTKLQHHFQEIGIVFAGSQPSLMRWMFDSPEQPFYAQAEAVRIDGFDASTTETIVDDGFDRTGRDAGTVAASIHQYTAGHPYRTMQLADAVWQRTAPGATAGRDEFASALRAVQELSAHGNETLFSTFDQAERAVLRLIASLRPLYGAAADLMGVSSSSASSARERLNRSGTIIVPPEGDAAIVDPVLADWIRTRLPI
jgi:uncharacterized protein